MNQNLRQKVINSIQYLGKSFYINQDNVNLEYFMNNEKNSLKTTYVALFSVLTYLSKGKQLITGTYGAGKTTTAEAIASIYESMPIEIISRGLLRCNPQLTEEKMIGRPDLGKLQQGIERVIWSYFTLSPTNIIDEFNRIPADKQILLLDAIDRGNFNYLNESIKKYESTYATKNELDGGNTELLASILDRFSIEIEVNPPVGYLRKINGGKEILSDKEIALKMENELKNANSLDGILSLRDEFQKKNKNLIFSAQEKERMFQEINNIQINDNAGFFLEYIFGEANFNPSFGYKGQPKINDSKNHYDNYLMNRFDEKMGLSVRWKDSIINYAKSLAWLKGEEEANFQTIKSVLPHTLIHKLKDEINQEKEPLELNKTSNAIKISSEICERFLEDAKLTDSFNKKIAQAWNEKKYSIIEDWTESSHPYYEFLKASFKKEMNGSYDKI
jgi:MoxR-like ATPase